MGTVPPSGPAGACGLADASFCPPPDPTGAQAVSTPSLLRVPLGGQDVGRQRGGWFSKAPPTHAPPHRDLVAEHRGRAKARTLSQKGLMGGVPSARSCRRPEPCSSQRDTAAAGETSRTKGAACKRPQLDHSAEEPGTAARPPGAPRTSLGPAALPPASAACQAG